MKNSEHLRGEILKWILAILLGSAAFVATQIIHEVSAPFVAHILPAVSKNTLCWLVLLCALVVIYALALHFERSTPLYEKYSFDPLTGISHHKKSDIMVCSRCLLTGVVVPLVRHSENK